MNATQTKPQAWVGCLACYNEGRLVGEWVEGTEAGGQTPEAVHRGRVEWSTQPMRPTHEELWVFDHEGYGGLISGECSPMEAQRLAELLDSVDDDKRGALAAYVADGFDADDFEDAFQGEWSDFESFAYKLADSIGLLHDVPESVAQYFAMDRWARDLLLGGDYWTVKTPNYAVWVFSS